MISSVRDEFYEYIKLNQPKGQSQQINQVSLDRVYRIFQDKFFNQYEEEGVFSQQFFKNTLRKVTELIMNSVYKKQPPYVRVQQIVSFVSVLQHMLYNKEFNLPAIVAKKIQIYTQCLIVMESLQNMRTIFEDSRNSASILNYYENIYKNAYMFRITKLAIIYGMKILNSQFVSYLFKCMIQQKDGNLEIYDSKVTAQWIALSLVYFTLAVKVDLYKQKPVLSKILRKYRQSASVSECLRQINGDELCHFYNNVFIPIVNKLDGKQIERLIDDIKTDIDVSGDYIVSPIQNQNNTVLDNIVFSSSWQP